MVLTKASHDPFTLVTSTHHDTVFGDYENIGSGKFLDLDAQLVASIRDHHPGMTVTAIPSDYADLASYAAAGYARAELDDSDDCFLRWTFYRPASIRGEQGHLGDAYFFARYKYTWNQVEFIVYTVQEGYTRVNYILFPPDDDETLLSHSKITDALLRAVGEIQFAVEDSILVYDSYWTRSTTLYREVQKASWSDVILNKKMKKTLTGTVIRFFDSEKSYKDLAVPWKVSRNFQLINYHSTFPDTPISEVSSSTGQLGVERLSVLRHLCTHFLSGKTRSSVFTSKRFEGVTKSVASSRWPVEWHPAF